MVSDIFDEHRWFLDGPARLAAPTVVLAAEALVGGLHLLWHTYPPGTGGLFLYMGQAVAENGFVPPATLDGYTTVRLPFAYTLLDPYVLAVFLVLGVPPLTLALVLPLVLPSLAGLATYAYRGRMPRITSTCTPRKSTWRRCSRRRSSSSSTPGTASLSLGTQPEEQVVSTGDEFIPPSHRGHWATSSITTEDRPAVETGRPRVLALETTTGLIFLTSLLNYDPHRP